MTCTDFANGEMSLEVPENFAISENNLMPSPEFRYWRTTAGNPAKFCHQRTSSDHNVKFSFLNTWTSNLSMCMNPNSLRQIKIYERKYMAL